MRSLSRHVAAAKLTLVIYDNINMMWKVAEQIIGRTGKEIVLRYLVHDADYDGIDSMQNGTCATLVVLWKATREALQTVLLNEAFDKAPHLIVADIKLTETERGLYQRCLVSRGGLYSN